MTLIGTVAGPRLIARAHIDNHAPCTCSAHRGEPDALKEARRMTPSALIALVLEQLDGCSPDDDLQIAWVDHWPLVVAVGIVFERGGGRRACLAAAEALAELGWETRERRALLTISIEGGPEAFGRAEGEIGAEPEAEPWRILSLIASGSESGLVRFNACALAIDILDAGGEGALQRFVEMVGCAAPA